MDDKSKNMKTPFEFATLGDTKDVDAKSSSGKHGGGMRSPFSGLEASSSVLWPLVLVGIWLLVLIIEAIFTGFSAKGLGHWPVVMGDPSQISIMAPFTAWISHATAGKGLLTIFSFLLVKIASLIIMAVSVVCSAFMHANFLHFFGNVLVFAILTAALMFLGTDAATVVKEWFRIHCTSVGLVWLIVFVFSIILTHLPIVGAKLTFLTVLSTSTTPVVGASIGIFGLLGYALMVNARSLRTSAWYQLLFIALIVLAIALLYSRFSDLLSVDWSTSFGTTTVMAVAMHYFGFVFGCVRGIRVRIDN